MIRLLLISALSILTFSLKAQFTYFNNLYGEEGDMESESTGNIEVVGDSIYVFGVKNTDGVASEYFRIFDNDGAVIQGIEYEMDTAFVFSGFANSFLPNLGTTGFIFSQAIVSDDTQGLVRSIGPDLQIEWYRTYSEYAPYTYFYTHAQTDSGYVLAGEHGPDPGERGTFIMEIDALGNVLWHNEIHAPDEGLFRNVNISRIGSYYIVSGIDQNGNDSQSYVEILSNTGEIEHHLEPQGIGIGGGGSMRHLINNLNEVILCQGVSNEWFEPPSLAYNSVRVYKLGLGSPQLELQNEFFLDEEWYGGSTRKIIEVQDGYVLMGGYRETVDDIHQRKAWIMKIDDAFQQEWYTELSYDDAPGNAHYPYDMEQTSDGGYVVVGAYRNSADFYDRTWLVKVDACGDLEWQGCEPVGIQEIQIQDSRVELYPNPAHDILRVVTPSGVGGSGGWTQLSIIDITGKVVKEMSNIELRMMNISTSLSTSDEVELDISRIPAGLYSIAITSTDGKVFSRNIVIE